MPKTPVGILNLLTNFKYETAYGEEPFARRKSGGCSMLRFGMSIGFISGILAGRGTVLRLLPARQWQQAYCLGSKKDYRDEKAWKDAFRAKALELFPEFGPLASGQADSLLLWNYIAAIENGVIRKPMPCSIA